MRSKVKTEKGAITLIVLVTMLFLMAFLISMYIRLSNKAQISSETTREIAKKYNNIGKIDSLYNGYLSDEDVIPIKTVRQLGLLGSGEQVEVDGTVYTYTDDGYYALQNDLDLEGDASNQWSPLYPYNSNESAREKFTGVLDGLGHTITGLYINNTDDYQGLFGVLDGTVKNLNIIGGSITCEGDYIGAITGKLMTTGKIKNCSNSITVQGENYVGSMAGNFTNSIIKCQNIGTIIGDSYVTGGYFVEEFDNTFTPVDVWSKTKTLNKNYKFICGDDVAIVPKGFKVSVNVDEQTIPTGMVIQDKDENEFVWVPVPNISAMAVLQTGSSTDYRGVLYHSVISGNTYSWSATSSDYREPDVVTDCAEGSDSASGSSCDAITTNLSAMGFITGDLSNDFNNDGVEDAYDLKIFFQQNYNNMVKSVKENGGFYVGRYEMSYGSSAQSKAGETSLYNSTAANNWYGLYAKARTYSNPGVTAEMIWGSQYEAILLWLIRSGVQNIDQNSVTDVTGQACVKNTGSARITGGDTESTGSKDKLCNIYDLWGNSFEWTQEAKNQNHRAYRSASYNGEYTVINRGYHVYNANDGRYGTRIALYIKSHSEVEVPTISPTGVFANNANIKEVREGNIPIPTGYNYVKGDIFGGAVIRDGDGNEFVWIPVPNKDMIVATPSNLYTGSGSGEPKRLTNKDNATSQDPGGPFEFDSQGTLDHYYGSGYYTFPADIADETNVTDFSYAVHYKEMAISINTYGGFYIGRYETTKDSNNNIGSKVNTTVLRSNLVMNSTYPYRWWGLYYAQRHANVTGNGTSVQANMIWGQQWNKMLAFFDANGISYSEISLDTYNKPSSILSSGQAVYTNKNDNSDVFNDIIYNIYDLRMNIYEWTADAYSTIGRARRGGCYSSSKAASYRDYSYPTLNRDMFGSRLTLCIK